MTTGTGTVTGIWIAPIAGAPMAAIPRAIVEAERGIIGDRYHAGIGSFSRWKGTGRAVTFIARESLEALFHRGGIRADVITPGGFSIGDTLKPFGQKTRLP